VSVQKYVLELISMLESGNFSGTWRVPLWISKYRLKILSMLIPINIIIEYTTYHDCGKPYCLSIDKDGKRHFPNHAQVSEQTWKSVGGHPVAAKLMGMDMMIHTMKSSDVEEFIKHPEAITLLITGLSEIHSNAQMFGGIDSTSFKIKWKQIDKKGKIICEKLFGE
jgi:hypothetical protein